MSLTDAKIRKLKRSAKPFKISDSRGLYLLVNPGGSRLGYLKFRRHGKESRICLGSWPGVSLADARMQRDDIRQLLAQDINPVHKRSEEKTDRLAAVGAGATHRKPSASASSCSGVNIKGGK